jgi:hypothetical protein
VTDPPRTAGEAESAQQGGSCGKRARVSQVSIIVRVLVGMLATTLLVGTVSVSDAQGQALGPQLSLEQVQRWCFQNGQPGCQGEWLQLQPDRVQFSSDGCDTVFILPAVVQQGAQTNRTPAVVVVDSVPQELPASAHRSGNTRVMTNVCMIELEAS